MRIVIVGAGFAGMYAALSAARLRDIQGVAPEMLEIVLVSPEPTLVVRPRLYEANPETLTAPLLDVLKAIDVVYLQGSVETIDTKVRAVKITTAGRAEQIIAYDRLILATGSRLFRPDIPGLAQYGFSVDQLGDAIALDRHLHDLAKQPSSKMRDTVVVAGGGIRVNAVAAGPTETGALTGMMGLTPDQAAAVEVQERARIPLGRRGVPDDVAEWLVRLTGPATAWMTGQVIDVDGGLGLA
jgi:NADH dehydrogenase